MISAIWNGARRGYGRFVIGLAAATGCAGSAQAVDWTINQNATTSLSYSDNIDLDPDSQKESAITPRVDYGIRAQGMGARTLFDIDGHVGLFWNSNRDKPDNDNAIRALGRGELWEDHLFIDAAFSSMQELSDSGGKVSLNPNADPGSLDNVTSISLSPVLQFRFGSNAEAQARYTHTEIWATGDTDDSRSDSAQMIVAGGDDFRIWKPATTIAWASTREDPKPGNRDDSVDQLTFQLANQLRISSNYALLGTIGYDNVDANTTRDLSGLFWSAGVMGTPGPRTTFSLQVGQRYDSWAILGDGTYIITPSLTLRLTASQDLGTGVQRSATQIQRVDIHNPAGLGFGGLPVGFIRSSGLDDGLSVDQSFGLTLIGTFGRSSVTWGYFWDHQEFDTRTERSHRTRINFTHQITQDFSVSLGFGYRYTDDGRRHQNEHTFGEQINFDYQLGTRTTLFFGLGRTDRIADQANDEYTENYALVGGRINF